MSVIKNKGEFSTMKKKLISFFMILQIVTAVALCGCTGDTTGDGPEQKSSDSSVKYGGKLR